MSDPVAMPSLVYCWLAMADVRLRRLSVSAVHLHLQTAHVDGLPDGLPARGGVGDERFGGRDLGLQVADLVELLDECGVVAEYLQVFELGLDLPAQRFRTVEVQARLLVTQLEVAREDGRRAWSARRS